LNNSHHHFIEFAYPCGQWLAWVEGFKKAKGKLLVTLDGDGQNDPKDIPNLVQCLIQNDVDMVCGYRIVRKDGIIKKVSSKIANRFRNWVTKEKIRDVGCSLRVFHRSFVENVPFFNGMHRFFPTIARLNGCQKILEIPVQHRPRIHGVSKYGVRNRLGAGFWDTFVVRWMKTRFKLAEVKETSPGLL